MSAIGQAVLVVDDDPINISIMTKILDEQYDLATATSGEEALEAASRLRPDLILLDLMMPGIDGYETCRRIRADPDLKYAKIVLVSARTGTVDRIRGYEVGADDFIRKPFNSDELLAKVRVFLRLSSVEQLDLMKSQLVDLVAHEIRTPLTGIIPAGEVLASQEAMEDAERLMWGKMVLDNGKRLLSLAERGLLLCQFRGGSVQLNPAEHNLTELFVAAVEEIRPIARGQVTVQAPDSLVFHGDRQYLKMMFEGILSAVVSPSTEGGDIRVSLSEHEGRIEFLVTSSALKIDPQEADHLFEALRPRFVHGQVVGSDLQLPLAKAIMDAHQGDLTLRTEPNGEDAFVGWLPLRCEVPTS